MPLLLGQGEPKALPGVLCWLQVLSRKETHMRNTLIALLLTGLLAPGGAALAQTKDQPTRSTASLECSKQADEKGLHGKARKTFRAKCLKSMKNKSA
jgi:psiF repeat